MTEAETQSWRVVYTDLYHQPTHTHVYVFCLFTHVYAHVLLRRLYVCLAGFVDYGHELHVGIYVYMYVVILVSVCAHHFPGAGRKGRTAWR